MNATSAPHPQIAVAFRLNDRSVSITVDANALLADVLRRRLGMTGTKVSCDSQVCGTCTVLVDGRAVSSCTFLAADADGCQVETIEGLGDAQTSTLSRLQGHFVKRAAFQCGYCTPGFIMTAKALLAEIPSPTREEVVEYLDGSICRCTGYAPIVEAILDAAHSPESEVDG